MSDEIWMGLVKIAAWLYLPLAVIVVGEIHAYFARKRRNAILRRAFPEWDWKDGSNGAT